MARVDDVEAAYYAAWREEMDRRWKARECAERDAYAAVTDPRVRAVLDVIAPEHGRFGRAAIFEWGHETTPEPHEIIELARRIVAALERVEAKR